MDVAVCVSNKNVAGNVLLPKTSSERLFCVQGFCVFISKCSVTSRRSENDKTLTRQF